MFKEQRKWGDNPTGPRPISRTTAIAAIIAIVLGVWAISGVVG